VCTCCCIDREHVFGQCPLVGSCPDPSVLWAWPLSPGGGGVQAESMRRGSLERAMRSLDIFSVCLGRKQARAQEPTRRVLKLGGRCVDTNALEGTLQRALQHNVSALCNLRGRYREAQYR